MSQESLRVEFRVELGNRRTVPKPEPGAKVERQRQDRAARKVRNLALAYWIDHLIRSGKVADLAAVAKMCHVSRARVSQLVAVLSTTTLYQESIVLQDAPGDSGMRPPMPPAPAPRAS